MDKIVITEKTRNTKALRLKIYKRALIELKATISKHGSGDSYSCLCGAIHFSLSSTSDKMPYKFYVFDENNVFVELFACKPKKAYNGAYWFPRNEKGAKKRIAVLKKIIKKMEA